MIELREISAGYNGKPQISDISLRIPKGSITVIIGPNGCGKSTLLRTVSGLQKPYGGEVLLDGKPLKAFRQNQLAKTVSFLPQSRNPANISVSSLVLHGRFPYMGYPRRYREEDRKMAREAMEWAGVLSLAHRSVAELSGGERQKVYIAMLLAQNTPVILMDEPTSYLDISHKFEVLRLARQMKEVGKTVVMVLHDLDLALSYADQVALMNKGQLITAGTPEELYASGEIGKVFGVKVRKMETEGENQYYFRPYMDEGGTGSESNSGGQLWNHEG